MATLTLEIQGGLLLKALASAAAKKLTLEEHLEEVLQEAEEEEGDESQGFTDLESAIAQAIERATGLPKGKTF